MRRALATILLLAWASLGWAEEQVAAPPALGSVVLEGGRPAKPPRFTLVLSGGGARGAAHIGVLKVLEELHVVPDLIVGTSMGSIVGGLYAAGWTPERIEQFLKDMDWNEVFTDSVPRSDRSVRRKEDDLPFLVPARIRFKGLKPYFPSGLLGGQRMDLMLKTLELESTGENDFDRLPIPYRAIAADITTGEAVVIGRGSLATAMRASMSISGVFPPVELAGRRLVDGGAVANLAIGIAQGLGAERIIAVDISSPLSEAEEIGSFLSILSQMSGLLTVGNVQADIGRLRGADVYLKPELGDITFSDFKRATEAVAIGETAARAKLDALRAFSASDAAWQAFLARRNPRPPSDSILDAVRVDNASWVSDEVIEKRLEVKTGVPLGESGFSDAVLKLRALDYFGLIGTEFLPSGDHGTLVLDVSKKPYGRNLLQVGLSLHTDWETGRRSDSGFEFVARHQLLAVNRRGGEWQNTLLAGSDGGLVSRFYQPLDAGMRNFADASVDLHNFNPTLWIDGDPVARYSIRSRGGALELGRVFEHWGKLQVGPYWRHTEGDVNIGDPVLPAFSQFDAGLAARFRVDTLDTLVFPRHGTLLAASYVESSRSMGSDGEVRQAVLVASKSVTLGRHSMIFSAEAMKNYEPVTLYERLYRLGGVFRLSGLGENELLGDSGGLARVVYYSQISRLALGPIALRLLGGFSLETGQAYRPEDPVTWESLRSGGSIFLGAETPLGPSFVGWGFTEGGRQRFYISIGQRF